jgi:hypothetical protein
MVLPKSQLVRVLAGPLLAAALLVGVHGGVVRRTSPTRSRSPRPTRSSY